MLISLPITLIAKQRRQCESVPAAMCHKWRVETSGNHSDSTAVH